MNRRYIKQFSFGFLAEKLRYVLVKYEESPEAHLFIEISLISPNECHGVFNAVVSGRMHRRWYSPYV
jgi:hypothetical protein